MASFAILTLLVVTLATVDASPPTNKMDSMFRDMVSRVHHVRDLSPESVISGDGKAADDAFRKSQIKRKINKIIRQTLPGVFDLFVEKYDKKYSDKVKKQRYSLFLRNAKMDFLEDNSIEFVDWEGGINRFSDMTDMERSLFLGHNRTQVPMMEDAIPEAVRTYRDDFGWPVYPKAETVSWVARGAMTTPKSQGRCPVCWAFSAVGLLESFYYLRTGVLRELSVQQVVDCTYRSRPGCGGGWYLDAWSYVKIIGRIPTERDHPLKLSSKCRDYSAQTYNNGMPAAWLGSVAVAVDEEQIRGALSRHPVSAALHVRRSLYLYWKGVFAERSDCPSGIEHNNHAVVIAGYSPTYYIIRNSWGATWGEGGYFRMRRGPTCGLYTDVQWPYLNTKRAAPDPDSPSFECTDDARWCRWFGSRSCVASAWFRGKCGYTCAVCSCRDVVDTCAERRDTCESDPETQLTCKRTCGLCMCPPGTTLCRTRCLPYWSDELNFSECSEPIPSNDFHEEV